MSELIQRALELPWGFIMSTLVIRFVGVFIVLAILMAGMQLLGFIVSRMVSMQEAKKAAKSRRETHAAALADPPEIETGDEEMAAVIGAAIAFSLESEQEAARSFAQQGMADGSWAMAGRIELMSRRLPAGSQRRS